RKRGHTSGHACGGCVDVTMTMKTGGSPDAKVGFGPSERDPELPPKHRRPSLLKAAVLKPFPGPIEPSWLPYCWAISIFLCSRAVVALGLVFSQKYLPIESD